MQGLTSIQAIVVERGTFAGPMWSTTSTEVSLHPPPARARLTQSRIIPWLHGKRPARPLAEEQGHTLVRSRQDGGRCRGCCGRTTGRDQAAQRGRGGGAEHCAGACAEEEGSRRWGGNRRQRRAGRREEREGCGARAAGEGGAQTGEGVRLLPNVSLGYYLPV